MWDNKLIIMIFGCIFLEGDYKLRDDSIKIHVNQ